MSFVHAVAILAALVLVCAGWKVFRVIVGLGYGAIFAGVVAVYTGFNALAQGGGGSDALANATVFGTLAFLLGFLVGLAVQRLGAALMPVLGGLVAYYITSRVGGSAQQAGATILGLSVICGLVIFLLYDYFAAAFMALLVCPTLIPEASSFWRSLLADHADRFALLRAVVRAFLQLLGEHFLAPAWVVVTALVLRHFAWKKESAEVWSARPDWQAAMVAACLIIALSDWIARGFGIVDPVGAMPLGLLWIVLLCRHAQLSLARVPSRAGGWGALLWLAPTSLVLLPFVHAVELALVTDLQNVPGSLAQSQAVGFLVNFYGGLLWPRAALGPEASVAACVAYLALRWGLALVVIPGLLRAVARSNGLSFAPDTVYFPLKLRARNVALATVPLAALSLAFTARTTEPTVQQRLSASLRDAATWERVRPPGDCEVELERETSDPRRVHERAILRALVPGFDPSLAGQPIEADPRRVHVVRGCRGVTANAAGRGGMRLAVREPIGAGRMFVVAHTRVVPLGELSEATGFQAVVSVDGARLRVDAIRAWQGQPGEHLRVEALPVSSGPVVVQHFQRNGGLGESETLARVLRLREGRLEEVLELTTREDDDGCPNRTTPWRFRRSATLRADGPSVVVTSDYRWEQGQCRSDAPTPPALAAVTRRGVQRFDPTAANVTLPPAPEASPPPLPAAWTEWIAGGQGDMLNPDDAEAEAMAHATDESPPTSAPPPSQPEASAMPLRPDSVVASSFFQRRRERHPPEDAFDGVARTAWNDGVSGSGRGEWIEARFNAARRFQRVTFSAGYDYVHPRFGDLFFANAHLRTATLSVDGRVVRTVDVPYEQRQVNVDLGGVEGRSLRITATEVHDGQQWQDVCVTEVVIEGSVSAAPPTAPAVSPVAAAPPAPARRCSLTQPSSFHLRSEPTARRSGSRNYPAGEAIEVLEPTEVYRRGEQRLVRARVISDGGEGYVFLVPSQRSACGL